MLRNRSAHFLTVSVLAFVTLPASAGCQNGGLDTKSAEVHREYEQLHRKAMSGAASEKLAAFLFVYENADALDTQAQEAVDFLTESAALGNTDAEYNLGYLLQTGTWVGADQDSAREFLLRAANDGHEVAQFWLGINYADRFFLESNAIEKRRYFSEAEVWFQRASAAGIDSATVRLGVLLLFDAEREAEGVSILEKAASNGSAAAADVLRNRKAGN